MPTIEDLIIKEVQNYPLIYSSLGTDDQKYFAAIAKKIGKPKINGPVVRVLWEDIVLQYIQNLNLEQINLDRDHNDVNYPKMNTYKMAQLDFLRPHLYNPGHQISSTLGSVSSDLGESFDVEDDCDDTPQSPEGPLNSSWQDESSLEKQRRCFDKECSIQNFKEDGASNTLELKKQISKHLEQLMVACSNVNDMREFYEKQFESMFEKIDDKKKLECYIKIVDALNKM